MKRMPNEKMMATATLISKTVLGWFDF